MDEREVKNIQDYADWLDENPPENTQFWKERNMMAVVSLHTADTVIIRTALQGLLEHRVDTHPVTGIKNQNWLVKKTAEFIRSERRSSTWVTLCFCDLRGFKIFNDQEFHARGDRILRAIAEALQKNVRCNDLVASRGGDEFLIMLSGESWKKSVKVVNRCKLIVDNLDFSDLKPPHPIKIDIGAVCVSLRNHPDMECLDIVDLAFHEAERLMGTAKKEVAEEAERTGGDRYLIAGAVKYAIYRIKGLSLELVPPDEM